MFAKAPLVALAASYSIHVKILSSDFAFHGTCKLYLKFLSTTDWRPVIQYPLVRTILQLSTHRTSVPLVGHLYNIAIKFNFLNFY